MRTSGWLVTGRRDRCLAAQALTGECLAPLMKSAAIPHTCEWVGRGEKRPEQVGERPRAGLPRWVRTLGISAGHCLLEGRDL